MEKSYRLFYRDEEVLSCILSLMMVVLAMCSALAWLVKHPISWSIDVAQLLLAWTRFPEVNVAFCRNKLVDLDLFTRGLPEKIQKAVTLVIQVIMLGALMIFTACGLRFSVENWKRSPQILTTDYSFVTLSLPVSSVLMSITALLKIRESISQLVEVKK